jgi:hypothetical protein
MGIAIRELFNLMVIERGEIVILTIRRQYRKYAESVQDND